MKKVSLIVCAIICSTFYVSAQEHPAMQTTSTKKTIDWSPKYKGEVNVGYTITGNRFLWDYEYSASDGDFEHGTNGYMRTELSHPLIETVHGVEIGPYFFIGAGIGLQYYYGKLKEFQYLADDAAEVNETGKPSDRWNAIMLPIFANIKLMYPINNKVTPFLNFRLGGTVGCHSSTNYKYIAEYNEEETSKVRGGFYCDFGAGIRYKALNFSLGLQHQVFGIGYEYMDNYEGYYCEEEKLSTKINSFYVKIGINF